MEFKTNMEQLREQHVDDVMDGLLALEESRDLCDPAVDVDFEAGCVRASATVSARDAQDAFHRGQSLLQQAIGRAGDDASHAFEDPTRGVFVVRASAECVS